MIVGVVVLCFGYVTICRCFVFDFGRGVDMVVCCVGSGCRFVCYLLTVWFNY